MYLLQTVPFVPSADDIEKQVDSARIHAGDFAEALVTNPSEALHQLAVEALHFGLKVLLAFVIYFVGAWLIKLIKKTLQRRFEARRTDKTVASFVTSFTSVSLTLLLIVLTISTLGVNTTSIAALLAGGGVALGMALSGTLQNFSGGLLLLAFKPFRVGDFIEAQGYAGTVAEMSIVSTRINLPDNRSVTIPHGTLANGNINNYTRNPVRRLEWKVSLSYGTDVEACKAKLIEILAADPRVLDQTTPGAAAPMAALFSMDDSSITFVLRGWVKNSDYWDVFFSVNETVYKQLQESGFSFPFPQLDVHVKP